ncbi:MAG: sensor histidine kinase, partial [Nitrospirota bacterium]
INLVLEINSPEGVVIEGDADRLRQLFTNLVVNALRYTPEGGKVEIALKTIAGVSEVTVTDTGIGIPEAELPKIFERFYRVDKARARESGGSGLGLCICKWIVDMHHGDITIESKEGAGTKVAVMFI